MTTPSEPTAEEREAQLSQLRKRMAKAAGRKEMDRYVELKAEHDRLKASHVEASHAEMKAEMRARRARERAQVAQEAPRRWRLPRGFGRSPLARQMDREGPAAVAPQIPPGGLRPWRRSWSPMQERIWRP